VNDPQINLDVIGEGEPVLLIHGFLENNTMWESLLPHLDSFQCIIPDLPGHGQSSAVDAFSLETLADLCADILDAVDVRQAHVIGHSMGGYIGCALLERHPERVKSLLLFHSTATADSDEKKALRDRAIAAVEHNQARYNRSMITSLFVPEFASTHASTIEQLIAQANEMEVRSVVQALSAMKKRPDRTAVLSNRLVSLAYILGKHDQRIPLNDVLQEVIQVKAEQHLVIDSAAHMGQFESPIVVGEFMKNWISAQL
jgi:pimeloyl-ACP methyl ester carboxylesterase